MEYRHLNENQINTELFSSFSRYQEVTRCWRKTQDGWQVSPVCFTENWGQAEYTYLVSCLKNTVNSGGMVAGAFLKNQLKGFVSVEATLFGKENQYLNLSSIHTSSDMRGGGVGKALFNLAKCWAKAHGGEKLYISAHSAVETQSFYKAVGCTEALEYNTELTAKEPFDCQLEYTL